jgi:hypothetical protein
MAFVPAPNIIQVEIRATKAGQKIENRLHFNAQSAVTPAKIATVTGLVNVWAQARYFPWLPIQVQLRECVGTDLTVQNGDQLTITPEIVIQGGRGGDSMPNEVSIAVSLRTAARGRSARGRAYVLGLSRTDVVENDVGAVFATQIVTAWQTLIDDANDNSTPLTIVSYRSNKAPRPGGPVYFTVNTAVLTDTGVDSMRRRKPGVGQ